MYYCNNEYFIDICDWVYLKCLIFIVSNGCFVITFIEFVRGNIFKLIYYLFVNILFIYEYLLVNILFILFYEYLLIKILFIS